MYTSIYVFISINISIYIGEQKSTSQSYSEELKMRETQLDELRKQIVQWEGKLRQQQQLYEAVRSDRNHYSKGLIEAQDEIAELRKKFKIMGHQIEQLREEISAKDQVRICIWVFVCIHYVYVHI
jgi:chromosome segregation ATPase